jgi:hypothetical protein
MSLPLPRNTVQTTLVTLNKRAAVQVGLEVKVYNSILEVLVSNLGQDIHHPEGFRSFLHSLGADSEIIPRLNQLPYRSFSIHLSS